MSEFTILFLHIFILLSLIIIFYIQILGLTLLLVKFYIDIDVAESVIEYPAGFSY
jgi:hypothetical protein